MATLLAADVPSTTCKTQSSTQEAEDSLHHGESNHSGNCLFLLGEGYFHSASRRVFLQVLTFCPDGNASGREHGTSIQQYQPFTSRRKGANTPETFVATVRRCEIEYGVSETSQKKVVRL